MPAPYKLFEAVLFGLKIRAIKMCTQHLSQSADVASSYGALAGASGAGGSADQLVDNLLQSSTGSNNAQFYPHSTSGSTHLIGKLEQFMCSSTENL
jgi:hypothetical protein